MIEIYDFSVKNKLRNQLTAMTVKYCLAVVGWAFLCVLAVVTLSGLLWLSVTLAGIVTLAFLLWSVVFWNITYGRTRRYLRFLDNAETGRRCDIVVVFQGIGDTVSRYGLQFKQYNVTDVNNGQAVLIAEISVDVPLEVGSKYYITCAGDMLLAYKRYDD